MDNKWVSSWFSYLKTSKNHDKSAHVMEASVFQLPDFSLEISPFRTMSDHPKVVAVVGRPRALPARYSPIHRSCHPQIDWKMMKKWIPINLMVMVFSIWRWLDLIWSTHILWLPICVDHPILETVSVLRGGWGHFHAWSGRFLRVGRCI